jgi:hypothetical protein
MPENRFRFRISHLLAATTVVAAVLTAAFYLPTTYETDGSVNIFMILLPFLLAVAAIGLWNERSRKPTAMAIVVACSAFSLRQVWLMARYRHLQAEVSLIIAHVEAFHAKHGQYPSTLASYDFARPELKSYIRYEPVIGGTFDANRISDPYRIRFHPTHDEGIGHWYARGRGYFYEDD